MQTGKLIEIFFVYLHRYNKIIPQTYSLEDIGISVSMFFILKIVLHFFDKLFFFTFFVI